jgi:glutamate formiminotransferase
VLECVVNVSEGRSAAVLDELRAAAGADLLDVHTDPHHHRSVFTLVGEDAVRRLAGVAVARLDLRGHDGVHPRIGVVDVVPFVPLPALGSTMADALAARDRYAEWSASALAVPCLRYGPPPDPTLPDVRKQAPSTVGHASAGLTAVGARDLLVAYNLWLVRPDLAAAQRAAAAVRGDGIRALGLAVGARVQVSMNLIDPLRVGPGAAWDRVAATGVEIAGAELVGLVPEAVLRAEPPARWDALDLGPDRTIEARLVSR